MRRETFWFLMSKVGLVIMILAALLTGMPLNFIGVMMFLAGASIWGGSYGRLFEMNHQS